MEKVDSEKVVKYLKGEMGAKCNGTWDEIRKEWEMKGVQIDIVQGLE